MCLLRHTIFLIFFLILLASSRDIHQRKFSCQHKNIKNRFLVQKRFQLDRSSLESEPADDNQITIEIRALAETCLIAHCNKCNRIKKTCIGCANGYELKNTICEELKVNNKQEDQSSIFSFYILIVFATLLIVSIACCGLAIYMKKKIEVNPFVEAPTQIYTDIKSLSNNPINDAENDASLSVRNLVVNDYLQESENNVEMASDTNLRDRKGSFDQNKFDEIFAKIPDDEKINISQKCAICSFKLKCKDFIRIDSCLHLFHEECIMDKVILSGNMICPLSESLTEGNRSS